MFLLPRHLQEFLKGEKKDEKRPFPLDVDILKVEDLKAGSDNVVEQITPQEFEVYPEDPSVRKPWFSLTGREREVAALVCIGYRDYEIASKLGIGYQTELTYMQNIFGKFGLRNRGKIRAALVSWSAEEWWKLHHR